MMALIIFRLVTISRMIISFCYYDFSQIFKKTIGMTPLQYRQNSTQEDSPLYIKEKFIIEKGK